MFTTTLIVLVCIVALVVLIALYINIGYLFACWSWNVHLNTASSGWLKKFLWQDRYLIEEGENSYKKSVCFFWSFDIIFGLYFVVKPFLSNLFLQICEFFIALNPITSLINFSTWPLRKLTKLNGALD